MKITRILTSLLLATTVHVTQAELFTFAPNAAVPDGRPGGWSEVESLASGISQIGSVQVSLTIAGNFNGDLYCYLRHNDALAVLLNRPGRSVGDPAGYDDSGFNITLSDQAPNGNIHTYQTVFTPTAGWPVTGLWRPDGRLVSPDTVLDTDPASAGLSLFNGADASGTWTLFIADMVLGGTSVLQSWQLQIQAVPEPSAAALALLGAGLVWLRPRRRLRMD